MVMSGASPTDDRLARRKAAKAKWTKHRHAIAEEGERIQGRKGGSTHSTKRVARTPEIEKQILDILARGKGVTTACKELGLAYSTVLRWRTDDLEFDRAVMRARIDGADCLADETIEIADNSTDDANTKRVRVDARKWLASKLKPTQYGEQLDLNVHGKIDTGLTAADLTVLAQALAVEQARRNALDVVPDLADEGSDAPHDS